MATFQILDDGEIFAIAIAVSIDSPATSIEGGEDFYAAYSYLIEPGEKYLSPAQYAVLLGGNGSGSVRQVDTQSQAATNGGVDVDENEIYIACLTVWDLGEKSFRTVPMAVLSVHSLDGPAREAVPILDSGIHILIVDQFRNDPRGVTDVANDLGLSLMESHGAATVFGGEIFEEKSAQSVAEKFGVPHRPGPAARRVARRG